MAVSKKIRFDVFKRDRFTCQYCGSTPPSVILELDHVDPKANGGLDLLENLVTACFDCNRGKSDKLLTAVPPSLEEQANILKEREDQLKAYRRQRAAVHKRQNADIALIERVFGDSFPNRFFVDRFKNSIRRNFLPHFTAEALADDMSQACDRMRYPEAAIKYFCGICWRKIKRNNGDA